MSTYTFEKFPGGASTQKDSDHCHVIDPKWKYVIRIEDAGMVTVCVMDVHYQIDVVHDTVVIDETFVGGSLHTYNPNTITSQALKRYLANVFNANSNFIMP